MAQTISAVSKREAGVQGAQRPTPRTGQKQTILIALVHTTEGAAVQTMIFPTGWQADP